MRLRDLDAKQRHLDAKQRQLESRYQPPPTGRQHRNDDDVTQPELQRKRWSPDNMSVGELVTEVSHPPPSALPRGNGASLSFSFKLLRSLRSAHNFTVRMILVYAITSVLLSCKFPNKSCLFFANFNAKVLAELEKAVFKF